MQSRTRIKARAAAQQQRRDTTTSTDVHDRNNDDYEPYKRGTSTKYHHVEGPRKRNCPSEGDSIQDYHLLSVGVQRL